MKQGLSLTFFILGLALILISFGLRESYEKEMYQLYIDQQQENLIKGWTKSWQEYVVDHYMAKDDSEAIEIIVDRSGRILQKNFFPSNSAIAENWESFEDLVDTKKEEFLRKQLDKVGSWDRAMAIKKLSELGLKLDHLNLSLYEQTLIDNLKKYSVKLIFKQMRKKTDYTDIGNKLSLDLVLMKSESNGRISLQVPSLGYLLKNLFNDFKRENNIKAIGLEENPFEIRIKEEFNPFKFDALREKILMLMGFVLFIISVGLYLWELRNKRLQIQRKVSFLNQLVHEVKTPITGIRLNSELLLKHGHDKELIASLIHSSKRLNDFFEDIILINRNDEVLNKVELGYLEFLHYLEDILLEFEGRIKLVFAVKDNVFIDSGRLRVALRNLLKNAIRYGDRGHLNVKNESGFLILTVQDEGEGVAREDESKIFEEFYRSANAKNQSPDGLGIGLSISANLVRQMSGEIKLLNAGEKMAIFELRLKSDEA